MGDLCKVGKLPVVQLSELMLTSVVGGGGGDDYIGLFVHCMLCCGM